MTREKHFYFDFNHNYRMISHMWDISKCKFSKLRKNIFVQVELSQYPLIRNLNKFLQSDSQKVLKYMCTLAELGGPERKQLFHHLLFNWITKKYKGQLCKFVVKLTTFPKGQCKCSFQDHNIRLFIRHFPS